MDLTTSATSPLPAGAPAAARAVLRLMQQLPHGSLDASLPDGSTLRLGRGAPHARISVHDWAVCSRTMKAGDIGFAESFIDGEWHTPDLPALLRLFIANRDAVESLFYGSWWGSLLYRLKHSLNRNSRAGSRKNIHAHYDLGNDFYALWLDGSMTYSSGSFDGDLSQPLEVAQAAKLRRALQQCGVQPGGRLLEVGCGWGSLAECAAGEFGARVTGLTLSPAQLGFAQQRIANAGLADCVELRLQDYRDLRDEPFDAIVSIEMFEAVGREYWSDYFEMLRERLKPGGRACVQSITIRDDLFDRYVRSTDFIQQYIFPGGLLPSVSQFRAQAQRAGLRVVDEFAFGPDYAETLRRWRQRFHAQERAVRELGFDTRFLRIWDFYLAYCEAAFDTGNTDVVQFTLQR